jgi:hypothetical protein
MGTVGQLLGFKAFMAINCGVQLGDPDGVGAGVGDGAGVGVGVGDGAGVGDGVGFGCVVVLDTTVRVSAPVTLFFKASDTITLKV